MGKQTNWTMEKVSPARVACRPEKSASAGKVCAGGRHVAVPEKLVPKPSCEPVLLGCDIANGHVGLVLGVVVVGMGYPLTG